MRSMPKMYRTPNRTPARLLRRAAVPMVVLALLSTAALPAAAARRPDVIVLSGARSAEGIAAGPGSTFFAGDLIHGDIFRGDFATGTAGMFIDVPDGRMAVGMAADVAHGLLFVAGGQTGQAYVYDITTGATVRTYQLGDPATSIINDVVVTSRGAWFTDSKQATLSFIPVSADGVPGQLRKIVLSGPAADTSGAFNLNGIAAAPDGRTLVVAHSANGRLYTVNPATGSSAVVAGVNVPAVDGIVLQGKRLWAIQILDNKVSEIRLSRGLDAGTITKVITDERFQSPTTATRYGDRLAVVQGKTDTGFPPTASTYDVVLVPV
jgi:sugar lactone lactonase YvrE